MMDACAPTERQAASLSLSAKSMVTRVVAAEVPSVESRSTL